MYTRLEVLLEKYDAIFLTSPYNMQYFSGFTGGEGAVWVSKNSKTVLTDSRYTQQAALEADDFEVVETSCILDKVCEYINSENLKSILFEDDFMSTAAYLRLKNKAGNVTLSAGSNELGRLRMIKTDKELSAMAEAELICSRAFDRILGFIKPGISEKTLAAELEYYIRQEGGEGFAFDTIAISGERCSLPHGTPSEKLIEKGDFVTLDFGCRFKGYCSDMTRTVVVGKASERQKEIYEIVKEAQQGGLEAIYAGAEAKACDFAARSVIEKYGYGKYFGHSLGHGVGILVHELPNLSPKSEIVLEENMVVTCEPGIYIPDFGGVRIEDMVCVKKNGNINMTSATKELLEL